MLDHLGDILKRRGHVREAVEFWQQGARRARTTTGSWIARASSARSARPQTALDAPRSQTQPAARWPARSRCCAPRCARAHGLLPRRASPRRAAWRAERARVGAAYSGRLRVRSRVARCGPDAGARGLPAARRAAHRDPRADRRAPRRGRARPARWPRLSRRARASSGRRHAPRRSRPCSASRSLPPRSWTCWSACRRRALRAYEARWGPALPREIEATLPGRRAAQGDGGGRRSRRRALPAQAFAQPPARGLSQRSTPPRRARLWARGEPAPLPARAVLRQGQPRPRGAGAARRTATTSCARSSRRSTCTTTSRLRAARPRGQRPLRPPRRAAGRARTWRPARRWSWPDSRGRAGGVRDRDRRSGSRSPAASAAAAATPRRC